MDWANEPYVRMYTRVTADDAELTWEALALWRALLCEFDQSGLFPVRNGWVSVSAKTRIPFEVVERASKELLRDGRIRMVETGVYCPNFTAAQTTLKSDKARQRESRDRRRAAAESMQVMEPASSDHGPGHETSHAVTDGHTQSQTVTKCHSLLCSALHCDPVAGHCVVGAQGATTPGDPVLPPSDPEPSNENAPTVADAKPKPKRGTQLPPNWEPSQTERDRAKQLGVNIESELEHFSSYHTAKGSTFRDWDAAFRTWLLNGKKWNRASVSARPTRNADLMEWRMEQVREAEERERNGGKS